MSDSRPGATTARWRPRVLLAWFALAVALGFGAAAIARDADGLASLRDEIDWWALPGSTLAVCLGLWCTAMCWRWFVQSLGYPAPASLVPPFFLTQVGKYVPGAVWPVLAQAEVGRRLGLPRSALPTATALFMVAHITTGCLAGAAAGLAGGAPLPWWVLVGVLLAGAIGVLPWPARWAARLLSRFLAPRRAVPGVLTTLAGGVSRRCWWTAHGWMLLTWAPYGASLWVILASLGANVSFALATSAFALAWVAGFLVIIAPAGVGPRDAAMGVLLVGAVAAAPGAATGIDSASSLVLAAAIASRLTTTLGDVVMALGSLAARKALLPTSRRQAG